MPTILIVDDERHMRLLLERCLLRTGARLLVVERGDEAVSICQRQTVDLVVLDFVMPGMDGVETLRAIRALPEGARIAAIMLTARGQADFEVEARALGVSAFFGKPFSPSELTSAAAELLSGAGAAGVQG